MQKVIKDNQWVGIQAKSRKDGEFIIPVMDVRRERGVVDRNTKSINSQRGSLYMHPSYSVSGFPYQVSRKKRS